MAMEKTINNNGIKVAGTESVELENMVQGSSQFGIGIILTLAALVGLWGAACLVGGIAKSGSLIEMGRGFLTAVTGM